jgi:hypothetical protein
MSNNRFADVVFVGVDTAQLNLFMCLKNILSARKKQLVEFPSNVIHGENEGGFLLLVATPPLSILQNSFTIKVDVGKEASFLIGVTTDYEHNFTRTFVGCDENSWSKCGYGPCCCHNGVLHSYGDYLQEGMIIQTIVHFYEKALEFIIDGHSHGKVFQGLVDTNKPLYPAISAYDGTLQWTVLDQ